MHIREILFLIADIEILVALVAAVAFTVSYASFFNWRKTAAGRAVMWVFLSLITVSGIAALARWIGPDYFLREWFRAIGWAFVAYSVVHLVFVLWSNWGKGHSNLDLERKHQDNL